MLKTLPQQTTHRRSNRAFPLLISIVNYRSADFTIECLRSLEREVKSLPGTRVVVVENASGDDSAERIQGAIDLFSWHEWASLQVAPRNGGFAYGNNFAIRPALYSNHPPDYFLILNPDSIVRPGALTALVNFMDRHPNAGIAGTGLESPSGEPWHIAFRFPNWLSELDGGLRLGIVSKLLSPWSVVRQVPAEPCPTDWVSGACFAVRRQVFETIGLMDEDYFLFYEETDLCLRAKRAGCSCWYVPHSLVRHIGGQSTGYTYDDDAPPQRFPAYRLQSRRRYFVKNYGWLYAAVADVLWIGGFALWRLRRAIQCKPDTDPPYLLWDFIRHSALLNPFAL
ncbi:MAG TPA: glycosyltransferase family 2 protein [Oscillatoriales cyanobacterium M59_W2019_021]|nr:glycosyltransferase family 2 protein [Oscillatoriales cyanobacterium M4454_W2019_049]HIK50291.1 glycosyltransferase family 2 protein [Oscillatoriales cyanobacterium M59_W2019_021]